MHILLYVYMYVCIYIYVKCYIFIYLYSNLTLQENTIKKINDTKLCEHKSTRIINELCLSLKFYYMTHETISRIRKVNNTNELTNRMSIV